MSSHPALGIYRPSQVDFWFGLSLIIGFILFMIVQIFKQAQLDLEGAIWLLAALGGLAGMMIYSRKRLRQIHIYHDRLELLSQTTSRTIRWQELSHLSVDYNYGLFLLLELENSKSIQIYKSRQKASAPNILFDSLIEQIYTLSHQARLEKAITRYCSGQKVDFKHFQIDQHGIATSKASLAWSEIAALTSDSQHETVGVMRSSDQKAWKVFGLHHLSNSDILGALIGEFHPQLVDQRDD
jgi:hypothetical protein